MQLSIDKRKARFYLWVALGFTSLWLVHSYTTDPDTMVARTGNYLWAGVYVLVLNVFLFEWLLPFIIRKRSKVFYNFLLGLVTLFPMLMLYSFGLYGWRYIGIQLHIYTALTNFASITKGVGYHFPFSVSAIVVFGIAQHIYTYVQLKNTTQQLRIQKQEAELNYLRSQTNPHFLFNTLNNIYSLARDKSDLAPESILRLSKMLRFMLYETSGAYIAVEQELKIIEDYIALEKLRYDESLRINFNN